MAEARPPEVVDLSDLSDPIPQPRAPQTPQTSQKRSLVSQRRLRRWLTVGAVAVAGWAVIVWATRQSVTVDRPVFAAMTAAKTAEQQHHGSTPTSAAQPPGVLSDSPAAAPAVATAAGQSAALGKPPAKPVATPAPAAHARHRTVVAAKRVKARAGTRPALGDQPRTDRDQGDVRGQRPGRGRS